MKKTAFSVEVLRCHLIMALVAVFFITPFQTKNRQKAHGAIPVFVLQDANRPLLSHNGQTLAVMPEVGKVEVYNLITKCKLGTFYVPNAVDYAISADGRQVAVWGYEITGNDGRHYTSQAIVRVFEIASGKEVERSGEVRENSGDPIGYLIALPGSKNVSSDLKLVANLAPNKDTVPSVILGNLETNQLIRQFSFGEYVKLGIRGTVAMTPDARIIAATRSDLFGTTCKQTVVWDVATGKELLRFPFASVSVSISDNGQRLAITTPQGKDNMPEIWDIKSGRRISEIGLEFGDSRWFISSGKLSPDGKLLVTNRKNYLLLWNTDTGKLVAAQKAVDSDDILRAVSFSGDGRFLAMSSLGETAAVWRVEDILRDATVIKTSALVKILQ